MLFFLVFFISIYSFLIFRDTKGITFFGPNLMTDNEKMLRTAYQYSKKGLISWPGSVHYLNEGKCRAELREYWVIFAAVIQKFFSQNFKFTEHLNITLGIISHSL